MTPLLMWFIFAVVFGACVGSFLNVVIYRVPEGKSIVTPPSACPKCGYQLAWFDNVPVLGWLLLRGKCRKCQQPISIQYPMIEALTGCLFGGLFYAYYATRLRPDFGMGMDGLSGTWPVFFVHLVLIGALIASTVIDARLFIIPLMITWVVLAVALIVMPLSAVWLKPVVNIGLVSADDRGIGVAIGGVLGLVVANLLLWWRVLPRGFDELALAGRDFAGYGYTVTPPPLPKPNDPVEGEDSEEDEPYEAWIMFRFNRTEASKELLFILFPILGMVIGYMVTPGSYVPAWSSGGIVAGSRFPDWMHVLGGSVLGYLAGGGIIWVVRIIGTIGFNKEAMGLGDVHLLGAIGAVVGVIDVGVIFFVAPFVGLAYALATFGMNAVLNVRYRPIPYGPHLCTVALVMLFAREPMMRILASVTSTLTWLLQKNGILLS